MEYQFKNKEEELFHIIRVNGSSYEEYLRVVEMIQNINYTDANDRGFLHEAVRSNKKQVAFDLMERGIDIDLQDVTGNTALMSMVSGEQWDLFRAALQYHPNINLKNWRTGNSLLWNVVLSNKKESNCLAKELLKMGANPYSHNLRGKSVIDLATIQSKEELLEAFLQVGKPDYEEEIGFHIPRNAAGIFSMKMRDYQKFICVEGVTLDYLEEKIYSYLEICGGKKKKYQLKLVPIENTEWTYIRCSDNMDFYNYHNLMSWFWGIAEDSIIPKQNICVALHKNEERCSYYGVIEDLQHGDRMVGRFQNGESFSIYLPEAYKKNGNAKSYSDILPNKSVSLYLNNCGFSLEWLNQPSAMPGREFEVEMAVEN